MIDYAGAGDHVLEVYPVSGTVAIDAFAVLPVESAPVPAAPLLIAPTGRVDTSTPVFSWNESATAAWYYLHVRRQGVFFFGGWYEAGAICSGGICSVNSAPALTYGVYSWQVTAANGFGNSPVSAPLNFYYFSEQALSTQRITTATLQTGVEITLNVQGRLSTACTTIARHTQIQNGTAIEITLFSTAPAGVMCGQSQTLFNRAIVIDTGALAPGTYTVLVNGVDAGDFTLP